jgi:hypothetical protein
MQAAVMIHRMLWWKKGVLSLRAAMQARCCCDSQNALVQKVCYAALPCKLAAVMIHRDALVEEGCYPCAAMQAQLL